MAVACPAEGDHVAVVGSNRKLLMFPLDQLPVMSRGKGVLLQRYRDGSSPTPCVFRLADGLSWPTPKGTRTLTEPHPGSAGAARPAAPCRTAFRDPTDSRVSAGSHSSRQTWRDMLTPRIASVPSAWP